MPRKFLVVADDTPEFDSALRFAARRARSTGGRVALLRVLTSSDSNAHWSGVRDEIERAGFRLVRSGEFLRNPSDPRDWNASPRAANST